MSQLDLSLKIGWENPSTLSRIESGEVKPSRETVIKIANCLNVNSNELNIILRKLNYVELELEITNDYVENLINNIYEDWNKNKYPMLLIDVPLNLLHWNKATEVFFAGDKNIDTKLINKYKNKSYVNIIFDNDFNIRKNVLNWEVFAKVVVRNIYSWSILQGEDRGFKEALNKCLDLQEFRKYWEIIKNENEISPINYNIPFIYNHPTLGKISFYFTTFILREDKRFFVEQLVPVSKDDRGKLEEYLK